MHVGQIRNMAFDMAGGEYLATWDDDDWYHPKRLAFQIRHARPGKIQMFKNRIHVDLNSDVSGVWSSRAGGNSTMVFPRDTINRFPNWKKCADVQFANYFGKKEILDNPPEFYVRTIHGKNITDRNIMLAGLKPMDKSQSELVKTIRGLYKAHESGDKQ
jgi:glycosyltransferase involved in cell wall biosynthesis